jgi:hypothetical protein
MNFDLVQIHSFLSYNISKFVSFQAIYLDMIHYQIL